MKRLALFDIDGVLANDTHRVEHALVREWDKYFDPDKMSADAVWPEGRLLLDLRVAEGDDIQYLTGRREDRRVVTEQWLETALFPTKAVHMRPTGVKMPLANLKANFVRSVLDSGEYDHVVLFDDDPEVIRVVNELPGQAIAVLTPWHVKQKALIKTAKS